MNDRVLPTTHKHQHLQYFQKSEAQIQLPTMGDLKSSDHKPTAQTSTRLDEVKTKLTWLCNEHMNRPRGDNGDAESKRMCPQQHP